MNIARFYGPTTLDLKYLFGEVELLSTSHLRVDSDGALFHGITLLSRPGTR